MLKYKGPNAILSIYIPYVEFTEITKYCDELEVSRSQWIREAIRERLNRATIQQSQD